MNTAKKIWISASIICIIAGITAAFGAAYFMDFDFGGLNNMNYEKTIYTVTEEFDNIKLRSAECDVFLSSSDDENCTVHCAESDKIRHQVSVENKTLEIIRTDESKWYEHIGVFWGPQAYSITIYLPQKLYDELYISSVSGDITVPDAFKFNTVNLKNTSGDINFESETANGISAKTVSGDINIKNICGGSAKIDTVSGDINFSNSRVSEISFSNTSGDVIVRDVTADKNFTIHTTSGDALLSDCDAPDIKIKSISGDISGTLLSEKKFSASSVSGNIRIPDSRSDTQKCEISTTSGNIRISLK